MRKLFFLAFLAICHVAVASDIYPDIATNAWSLAGLSSISQRLIASGTSLPAVASGSAGDLFLVLPDARWYRHDGSQWATCTVELASLTRPGSVGTDTQSFSGNKTFAGDVTVLGTFTAQLASPTAPGLIGTDSQTIGGDKTFAGNVDVIGSHSADGYTASGVAGLASSDIELPYEWGASSWTLHIRGGLIVGVDTP